MESRFDRLTRLFAAKDKSRRQTLKLLLSTVLGGTYAATQIEEAGAVCGATVNSLSCSPGEDCCSGICYNTNTSNAHCGRCHHSCLLSQGESCAMGVCQGGDDSSSSSAGSSAPASGLQTYSGQTTIFSMSWDPNIWTFQQQDFGDLFTDEFSLTNGYSIMNFAAYGLYQDNVQQPGIQHVVTPLERLDDAVNTVAAQADISEFQPMYYEDGTQIGKFDNSDFVWGAFTYYQDDGSGGFEDLSSVWYIFRVQLSNKHLIIRHIMYYNQFDTEFPEGYDLLAQNLSF